MKRLITRVILPAMMISTWLLLSSRVCEQADGFHFFLFWIIAGAPFGIRRMCIWLIPWNYGISGGIGVLALNLIAGGLIGGVVLLFRMAMIVYELILIMAETIAGTHHRRPTIRG